MRKDGSVTMRKEPTGSRRRIMTWNTMNGLGIYAQTSAIQLFLEIRQLSPSSNNSFHASLKLQHRPYWASI